jgi:hypothetical protein
MAMAEKQTGRGRKQDRARVAGGRDYEVTYEATPVSRMLPKVIFRSVGMRPILPGIGRSLNRPLRCAAQWQKARRVSSGPVARRAACQETSSLSYKAGSTNVARGVAQ